MIEHVIIEDLALIQETGYEEADLEVWIDLMIEEGRNVAADATKSRGARNPIPHVQHHHNQLQKFQRFADTLSKAIVKTVKSVPLRMPHLHENLRGLIMIISVENIPQREMIGNKRKFP